MNKEIELLEHICVEGRIYERGHVGKILESRAGLKIIELEHKSGKKDKIDEQYIKFKIKTT